MDDNLTVFKELVSIGDAQEEAMDMAMKNADTLDRIEAKVSEPVEPPVVIVPDTVTVNNFPDTQKVEVINQEKVELDKVESLLSQLIKVVPTIKDERPTPTEDIRKLLVLLSQDKSKEKVQELLTQILLKEYPMYKLPDSLISKEGRIKVEVDRAGGGGGSSNKETLDSIVGNYALRMVEVGPVIYIGKALPSTSTSEPHWQIKKIDQTTGIIIQWADGDDLFDNVFDDYLTLTYL